jgi:hypothetical protein
MSDAQILLTECSAVQQSRYMRAVSVVYGVPFFHDVPADTVIFRVAFGETLICVTHSEDDCANTNTTGRSCFVAV